MLDNIKKLVKDNQYKEANKQLVDLIITSNFISNNLLIVSCSDL